MNLKSGRCPEDYAYCSQRLGSDVGILAYLTSEGQAAKADLAPSA